MNIEQQIDMWYKAVMIVLMILLAFLLFIMYHSEE